MATLGFKGLTQLITEQEDSKHYHKHLTRLACNREMWHEHGTCLSFVKKCYGEIHTTYV